MKLTPELIQQLFQQEPHMKAAFEEQVPHKLDQASFWRKYGEYLVLKVRSWLPHTGGLATPSSALFIASSTPAQKARHAQCSVFAEPGSAARLTRCVPAGCPAQRRTCLKVGMSAAAGLSKEQGAAEGPGRAVCPVPAAA